MHRRIGKAFFAQAVEQKGLVGQGRPPSHYINIVRDVAVAIKLYLEDTE